jgi:hypothetical protein
MNWKNLLIFMMMHPEWVVAMTVIVSLLLLLMR